MEFRQSKRFSRIMRLNHQINYLLHKLLFHLLLEYSRNTSGIIQYNSLYLSSPFEKVELIVLQGLNFVSCLH